VHALNICTMFSLRFYLYGLHGFGGVLTALVVMMSGFVGMRAYVGATCAGYVKVNFKVNAGPFKGRLYIHL